MAPLFNLINQQQITVNDRQYFFEVNPFEITNILGTSTAVLQEYCITGYSGIPYKLYKTKEG